ncbi:hypothetical protein PMZ80_001382 [Knufia obscura]|uniref:NADP-dependent oxidoreductase domain-containing protein n=1 Tax=Knufia obscura TaxID=1635080 RepID=A0ABR0S2Z1_9EURO|nr:hypothetical protein PMZ80_001382 [Knufia obscura]
MSQPQPTVLGRKTGHLGYGLMGLTWRQDPKPFEDIIPVMKRALELGADNWNAGEFYGTPDRNSMHLLKSYFTQHPSDASKVILCVKGGGLPNGVPIPDSSPENIRRSVDFCLDLLKDTSKKQIDIFECARVDPQRGNEQAIETLAEYVKAGKIGGIGISEVSAKTIRASQKQVKGLGLPGVTSVEIEMSLWCLDALNNGVLAVCAEEGIPVFAYSPLARGALSGNGIRKNSDLPEGPLRHLPKYQDDVLAVNNKITDAAADMAKEHGCTMPQIAIAWVRGQSGRTKTIALEDGSKKEMKLPTIIPIPGASTVKRVEENLKDVVLTEDELKTLDELVEKFPTQGNRYDEGGMTVANG